MGPRILHVVEIGIELALQHEELLPVLLPDGGQRVDVLLEPLARRLLLRGVREPRAEVLDQLVIGHPAVGLRQHVLPHRLQRELGRAGHLSSLFFCKCLLHFAKTQLLQIHLEFQRNDTFTPDDALFITWR